MIRWVCVFAFVVLFSAADAYERQELAAELMAAKRLNDLTANQLEAFFSLWDQHLPTSLSEETRQELEDMIAVMAAGMARDLADAYADQLSDAQLRDAIAFWSSPEGQRWSQVEVAMQANFFERFQLRMMEMSQQMSKVMRRVYSRAQADENGEVVVPEAVADGFLTGLFGVTPGAAMVGVAIEHPFASALMAPPDIVIAEIFSSIEVELTTLGEETRVVKIKGQRAFDDVAACHAAEQDLRGLLHNHFHPGEGSPCAEKRLVSPDLATTASIRCEDSNVLGWSALHFDATHRPTSDARMATISSIQTTKAEQQ